MNSTALSPAAKDAIRAAWDRYSTAQAADARANVEFDRDRDAYFGAMVALSESGARYDQDAQDRIDDDHKGAADAAQAALAPAHEEYTAAVAALTALYTEHLGEAGAEAVKAFTSARAWVPIECRPPQARLDETQRVLDELAGERLN